MKIKSIKRVKYEEPINVYDFTVDTVHHYVLGNGVVSHNSYIPTKEASGGGGIKYAASSTLFLSKKKDRDGKEVIGNIITVKMDKSRFTRDSIKVDTRLSYTKGLHKYYGLVPIAEELGIFKRTGTRFEVPSGKKVFEKEIYRNPEEYFTKEVLDAIDGWCKKNFMLGSNEGDDGFDFDEEETNIDISSLGSDSTAVVEDQEEDEE